MLLNSDSILRNSSAQGLSDGALVGFIPSRKRHYDVKREGQDAIPTTAKSPCRNAIFDAIGNAANIQCPTDLESSDPLTEQDCDHQLPHEEQTHSIPDHDEEII